MKIAINRCYGGFSLNNKVAKLLREKGVKVTFDGEYFSDGSGPKKSFVGEESHYFDNENFNIESKNYNAWRADKRLIESIEEVGCDKSGTRLSEIDIVEIPDDVKWVISEYDGIEAVEEEHRSW
jgi:hypothetical protein